ncbi:MAG: threonine aldolase family protein [Qingshengfaniella sp.]
MNFASDNAGPVHPSVLTALAEANTGYAPGYGTDPLTARVTDHLRALFQAPEAAICLVATGTAANGLALATLAQPWQTVFCAPEAHVQQDECGAPEFFSGGAKLTLVAASEGRIDPGDLALRMDRTGARGVHGVQRGPVTITQATENGTLYTPDQIARIAAIAHDHGQKVYMDGARFANAVARLGCAPADLSWRAGVDVLSFGGTKNGLMGAEAVILFDPALAQEFALRRKRAAHLLSKHRYLAAQMAAYLTDGLWLDLAARANAAADRLTAGLRAAGLPPVWPVEANMVFFRAPRRVHAALWAAGADYHPWDGPAEGDPDAPLIGRLVCDWSLSDAAINAFLDALKAAP